MGDPVRLPQPAEISEREKEDAMGAYLMEQPTARHAG